MFAVSIALATVLAAASGVAAAPARVGRPVETLPLVFLDGDGSGAVRQGATGDATLDVGPIVSGKCPRGCMHTVVQRRFRVRVDGRSSTSRFVRISAFVQSEQIGRRVRVDGRLLTSVPQLVDAASPLGIPVVHTLVIEVPTTEPEGLFAQPILWLVEGAP